MHIIKINEQAWELSECTCSKWLKNYKCNHTIAIAARLGLLNFDAIAMSMPLDKKRSRGRIPNRTKALQRDAIPVACQPRGIEISDDDEIDLPLPKSKRRLVSQPLRRSKRKN